MKKHFKFLLLFITVYVLSGNAQTVTPQPGQATNANQAVQTNTLLRIRKVNDTLSQYLKYLTTLTRYNNDKQDSMIASQQTTVLNLTLTSVNAGTAVVAGQTIGDGTYSVTVPTGNWKIESAVVSSSLQGASGTMRMFVFSGPANIPTQVEGSNFSCGSIAAFVELTSVYVTSTTNYIAFVYASTGAFQPFNILNTAGIQTDNRTYPSGTLKLCFSYGGVYTPAANNMYFIRIRMRRVS
jgi:hypothetical protein